MANADFYLNVLFLGLVLLFLPSCSRVYANSGRGLQTLRKSQVCEH